MHHNHLIEIGSRTAKSGFSNEDDIVDKFNSFQSDPEASIWLHQMGHPFKLVRHVRAKKISRFKADVLVHVERTDSRVVTEGISIKLLTGKSGFNQIDKRWVDRYKDLWAIPEDVVDLLKRYVGEIVPTGKVRDLRRQSLDEMSSEERSRIISFFESNRELVLRDILEGTGENKADWMLVTQRNDDETKWRLVPMARVVEFFGSGPIETTKLGVLRIGKVTMQRKGGDGGRESAKMLQFKINPAQLFDLE